MPSEIQIIPVRGIGEIRPGDALAPLLLDALVSAGLSLENGDVLVVTQKIVSKAEGRLVDPATVEPSAFAERIAVQGRKDASYQELVLRESRRIVKMANGVLITETHHGLICANSGIDESNVAGGQVVCLLPVDPDASAANLRSAIRDLTGTTVAVIISDTFGRPWRDGQVNVAIGCAGLKPLNDFAGVNDPYGYTMQGARRSATKSQMVQSVSCPTAEIIGIFDR